MPVREIAKRLTCAAVAITAAVDAPAKIDYAIRTALRERKPAYIEIACNIAAAPCAAPAPISAIINEEPSDAATLKAAVAAAAQFLQCNKKPVLAPAAPKYYRTRNELHLLTGKSARRFARTSILNGYWRISQRRIVRKPTK